MQITKKKICWRKGNTTYSAHLFSGSLAYADYAIKLRVGNETLLCPMRQGSQANRLCVTKQIGTSVNTFHAVDMTPVATVTFTKSGSSFLTTIRSPTITMNIPISNSITLLCNGAERGTLSAGSTSATFSDFSAGIAYTLAIKIGDWISSDFTTSGTEIVIPEAQWGV